MTLPITIPIMISKAAIGPKCSFAKATAMSWPNMNGRSTSRIAKRNRLSPVIALAELRRVVAGPQDASPQVARADTPGDVARHRSCTSGPFPHHYVALAFHDGGGKDERPVGVLPYSLDKGIRDLNG